MICQIKIKHIKHLLLKNHSSLTKEEKQNLEYVLNCLKKLRLAYELKEEFRSIYETDQPPDKARLTFEKWMEKSSQLFHASTQIIKNHIDGICNYFWCRTTSGVMEGINNKI
ncbi:transposase [Synechococcus sp. PCC 6312]|uniref:transposase n=1 Tax=Synechococcus sp. (strain ATCC 27167 / PCC 6312) TaxID=195253 RepID=UPI0002E5AD5E